MTRLWHKVIHLWVNEAILAAQFAPTPRVAAHLIDVEMAVRTEKTMFTFPFTLNGI